MRLFIGIVVLSVAGLLLAACSPSAGSNLTGRTWQWTASTTAVPASQSVVPDPENYTITFNSDGTFAAKVDCNQVAGTYTVEGSELAITPGPSTLAACPEASLDAMYLEGLGNAVSYSVTGEEMTLTLADDGTMQFDAT